VQFLARKWEREQGYRLRKYLWAWRDNRIAVCFEYEYHDSRWVEGGEGAGWGWTFISWCQGTAWTAGGWRGGGRGRGVVGRWDNVNELVPVHCLDNMWVDGGVDELVPVHSGCPDGI